MKKIILSLLLMAIGWFIDGETGFLLISIGFCLLIIFLIAKGFTLLLPRPAPKRWKVQLPSSKHTPHL